MVHEEPPVPAGDEDARTRQLEELLFQCLEARAEGDDQAVTRLLAAHGEHAEQLRQLLGIAAGLDQDAAPIRLGEYELLHVLGGGGMGVVHLARQRRLQRLVAVKLIRPELLGSAKTRERFHREARALARVAHPGICPVYDFGEVDGQPYLVMQYVAGRRLADLPPPSSRAELDALLQCLEQVCIAVQVAHDAGLVHRDLKPANVMLAASGQPVVLDFGLARMIAGSDGGGDEPLLTTQSQPIGTPAYMAPERLTGGTGASGPGVDVYALGVSLHQLVTGELPFASPVPEALWSQILRGEPPSLPRRHRWLPRELEVVLRTAMERDLARRYATAGSFGEDLRRLRLGLPILARRPSALARALRWTQRNRVVSGLLALLLLAFTGAAVLTFHLAAEQASNQSLALAGEAARQGPRSAPLQARLALAAIDRQDRPEARSELAQSLAQWHIDRRVVGTEATVRAAAPWPGGGMALVVDGRRVVVAADGAPRRELRRPDDRGITAVAVAADGRQVAVGGGDGKVFLLDPDSGAGPSFDVGGGPIRLLAYGPGAAGPLAIGVDRPEADGRRRAQVLLLERDAARPRLLGTYVGERRLVLQFAFDRSGRQLYAVVQGHSVLRFPIGFPGQEAQELGVGRLVRHIALVDDDRVLVAGCANQEGGAANLLELPAAGGEPVPFGVQRNLEGMACAADGRQVATWAESTVMLWDRAVPPAQRVARELRHPAVVSNVAFRADGQLLASSDMSSAVRLWTPQGRNPLVLNGNLGGALLLGLDLRRVWSASKLYGSGSLQMQSHGEPLRFGPGPVTFLLPDRDGRTVWTGHADGSVRGFGADGSVREPARQQAAVIAMALSADGRRLLSVAEGQDARVLDLERGDEQRLKPNPGELLDGWLLDGGDGLCLRTTGDAAAGNALWCYRWQPEARRFEPDGDPVPLPADAEAASLDQDTGRLRFGRRGGGQMVFDPRRRQSRVDEPGPPCSLVVRSPDGAWTASCLTSDITLRHADGTVRILTTDSSTTQMLRFSPAPGSPHLAAISHSGAVWLFGTADGELHWRGQLPSIGRSLAFTDQGRRLLTGSADGVVRAWLVRTGDQRELALRLLGDWQWNDEERRILQQSGVAAAK